MLKVTKNLYNSEAPGSYGLKFSDFLTMVKGICIFLTFSSDYSV